MGKITYHTNVYRPGPHREEHPQWYGGRGSHCRSETLVVPAVVAARNNEGTKWLNQRSASRCLDGCMSLQRRWRYEYRITSVLMLSEIAPTRVSRSEGFVASMRSPSTAALPETIRSNKRMSALIFRLTVFPILPCSLSYLFLLWATWRLFYL